MPTTCVMWSKSEYRKEYKSQFNIYLYKSIQQDDENQSLVCRCEMGKEGAGVSGKRPLNQLIAPMLPRECADFSAYRVQCGVDVNSESHKLRSRQLQSIFLFIYLREMDIICVFTYVYYGNGKGE